MLSVSGIRALALAVGSRVAGSIAGIGGKHTALGAADAYRVVKLLAVQQCERQPRLIRAQLACERARRDIDARGSEQRSRCLGGLR